MKRTLCSRLWSSPKVLIGVVHLPPLPGSPVWSQRGAPDLASITEAVLSTGLGFQSAGFDGLIVENFGDAPFYPGPVPAETIAAMTFLAAALQKELTIPLGINVLRNDGHAALAIAKAVGANFIRVNVLGSVAATDQGLISGVAHDLLRSREALHAGPKHPNPIAILADVHVKHARPLGEQNLVTAAMDMVERAGADAIVLSGSRTGSPPSPESLKQVWDELAGLCPIYIGSGLNAENAPSLLAHTSGAIAASAALRDGQPGNPIDPKRAKALIESARKQS